MQGTVIVALLAGVALGALTVDAPLTHRCVLALLAADLCGGLAAHLLGPAKAHAHRTARTWRDHLLWAGGHLIHLGCFTWLFRDGDLTRFGMLAALLVAGSAVILLSPAHMQRRIALATLGIALLAADALVGLERAAGWFTPILFTKVFIAYLPAPEPARDAS